MKRFTGKNINTVCKTILFAIKIMSPLEFDLFNEK